MTPDQLLVEMKARQQRLEALPAQVKASVDASLARVHAPGVALHTTATEAGVTVTATPVQAAAAVRQNKHLAQQKPVSPAYALGRVKSTVRAAAEKAIKEAWRA